MRRNCPRDELDRANLAKKNICESDFLAFSLIAFLAVTSRTPGLKIRSIFQTIVEDSMHYFLIIFGSHFVVEMTLVLGRVSVAVLSRLHPLKH